MFNTRHDASTHDAPTVARTMQVTAAARSVEDRSDIGVGRLASCHAIGACVYLAVPAPVLPAPAAKSGGRQIEPTLSKEPQSLGGLFRPPRLPANA